MIAIRVWWLLGAYAVGFFVFYYPTMRLEEAFLREKFGGEFEAYRKKVPFFFPWKAGSGVGDFSFSSVMRNKEHRYVLGSFAFLLALEGAVRLRAFLGR